MTNKELKKEFYDKFGEWLRSFLTGPHSTYEGDGDQFVEDLWNFIEKTLKTKGIDRIKES